VPRQVHGELRLVAGVDTKVIILPVNLAVKNSPPLADDELRPPEGV